MKILIIDDDKVDRASLKRDLRNTNLVSEIVEEDTGLSGIERFKQESFECVLLDYYLPDIQGPKVLQELVRIGGEFLSVIAITGTESETMPELMLAAGASDYLIKDEINTRVMERVLRFVLKKNQHQKVYEEQLRILTEKLEVSNKKLEKLAK